MTRPIRLHELTDRQFADFDSQPTCFMGCGNPVDEPGDCCSDSCEQLAGQLADQAAQDMYG